MLRTQNSRFRADKFQVSFVINLFLMIWNLKSQFVIIFFSSRHLSIVIHVFLAFLLTRVTLSQFSALQNLKLSQLLN